MEGTEGTLTIAPMMIRMIDYFRPFFDSNHHHYHLHHHLYRLHKHHASTASTTTRGLNVYVVHCSMYPMTQNGGSWCENKNGTHTILRASERERENNNNIDVISFISSIVWRDNNDNERRDETANRRRLYATNMEYHAEAVFALPTWEWQIWGRSHLSRIWTRSWFVMFIVWWFLGRNDARAHVYFPIKWKIDCSNITDDCLNRD